MAKNKPTWDDIIREETVKECTPPEGFQSVEQIAEGMERRPKPDTIRPTLNRLVEAGRAEVYNGKRMGSDGQTRSCKYYKLIG